jgi:hypothetical protein
MSEVKDKLVDSYDTYLVEKYRSPSKGGNTKALHSHVLVIDGIRYSFLALGSKKWVYKSDKVSFNFEVAKGVYNNIVKSSVVVIDKNGKEVVRGNRGYKQTLRTASQRLPCSRREARD